MLKILLISLIPISIFTVCHIVLKLLSFSSNARKYAYETKGVVVGYYADAPYEYINWYPIVKVNDNGNEILVKSKFSLPLPIFRINEKVNIKYYNDGLSDYYSANIYTKRLGTKKEEVILNKNAEVNILGIKNHLEYILEILGTLAIIIFIIK